MYYHDYAARDQNARRVSDVGQITTEAGRIGENRSSLTSLAVTGEKAGFS